VPPPKVRGRKKRLGNAVEIKKEKNGGKREDAGENRIRCTDCKTEFSEL